MRKLPILVERNLGRLRAIRAETAETFSRDLYDQLLASGDTLSCRSGCGNCCYHPVLITVFEGLLLYQALARAGRWAGLKSAFREHADKTTDLSYPLWLLSNTPCPLLDEKTQKCKSYANRPTACRLTVSIGEPEGCHPHNIQDSGIVNRQVAMDRYYDRQKGIRKDTGFPMFLLPLSVATLIGERVALGEIDPANIDFAIAEEVFT